MINQSNVVKMRGITRALMTTVVGIVLALMIFASTAFAGLVSEYTVEVKDGSNTMTVTTDETEAIDILNKSNITLGSNDKLDISKFDSGKGGVIVISRLENINVEKNGVIKSFDVYSSTVGEALKEANVKVGKNDIVNYALTDSVSNGMVITVKESVKATLTADKKTTSIDVAKNSTVADVLAKENVTLGSNDYTIPSTSTKINKDTKITVCRVTYKTVKATETIKYSTTKKTDSKLEIGKTKTEVKGVNGSQNVTYKVRYVNGKVNSKKVITKVVTKKPSKAVVLVGTKAKNVVPNGVQSSGSRHLGEVISGRYTHYCACAECGTGTGMTASGRRVYNGMPDPHYIACNWLPMGSVVSVDGTNYTVVDRGGSGLSSIGRIDIFTPEGHAACYRYGTGSCTLKIVRLGW